jgi:hypothetical protein
MSASAEFAALLKRMNEAAEAGDGKAFAACFTQDGVYHDYIYGDHRGRAEIAHMLEDLFHRDAEDYRWQFFDPVSDGRIGYAWSLSTFTSKVPEFAGKRVVIDGMSRFELDGGLIRDYSESVNGGVAMVQLGVAPERMGKVLQKWSRWLQERPTTRRYLER